MKTIVVVVTESAITLPLPDPVVITYHAYRVLVLLTDAHRKIIPLQILTNKSNCDIIFRVYAVDIDKTVKETNK